MRNSTVLLIIVLAGCTGDAEQRPIVGQLASDRIELVAERAEPVTAIHVMEGESVSRGQVLLELDGRRAAARLAEADAAANQMQARLDELVRGPRGEQIAAARASVAGATKELEFRESDYARVRDVHERNLASDEILDRAEAALDAARADDELRRAQLQELLTGTTVEELAQAQHAVEQATARRDQLAVDLERMRFVAPVDGIVDSRLFEIGEQPNPGQAVIIVLPATQPHALVYIPEELRVSVSPGLEVTVQVDGLDEPFPGRVRWVASEAMFTPYFALTERDRGHLSYEAKIDLQIDRDRLPDGVPVEVFLP
ncbi:MAG: HlyD family efflux transporter periplasmic adaptor subunit [Pseudomonadota bacterium]